MLDFQSGSSSRSVLALPLVALCCSVASAQITIYPLARDPALDGPNQMGSQYPRMIGLSGEAIFGSFVDFSQPFSPSAGTGRWGIDGILDFRDDYGPSANGSIIDIGEDGVSRITFLIGEYIGEGYVGVFSDGTSINVDATYGAAGGTYEVISPDGLSIFGVEYDRFVVDPKQYRYRPGGVRELVYDSSLIYLNLRRAASNFDGSMVIGRLAGTELVRWTEGVGLETIMPINDNNPFGEFPMDISHDGSVIVGQSPSNYPAVWREGLGVQELTDCPLAPEGVYSVQCSPDGSRIDAWGIKFGIAGFYTWNSTDGWRSLQQVMEGLGARDFSSLTSPVSFRAPTKNLDAVFLDYRDSNDPFGTLFETVAFIGVASPGAIGSNFCGPAEINASGFPALVQATGSSSVQANSLTMTARFLPAQTVGYVLSSAGSGFVQGPGASIGNLCLGGGQSIGRHNRVGEVGVADEDGTVDFPIDVLSLPGPTMAYAAQPGETLNFQVWFRDADPNGSPTSNFTDAVAVTFQ